MQRQRRYLCLSLAICFAVWLAACGGGDGDGGGGGGGGGSEGTYVTPGKDADLYAALLSDGENVLFYATDTESIHVTLHGAAPAADAPLSLSNEEGDSVEATPSEDGFSGTLTLADGSTHDFSLQEVSRNNGGLYRNRERIRGEDWIIGLIVLNDGSIVGASRNESTGDVEKRTTLSLGLKWDDPTTDP